MLSYNLAVTNYQECKMGRGKQSFKVVEVDDLIVCTLGILMIKVLYKYSNRAILPCASQFSHKCNIFFSGTVLLFVIAFLAAGVCWAGFSCPLRTVRLEIQISFLVIVCSFISQSSTFCKFTSTGILQQILKVQFRLTLTHQYFVGEGEFRIRFLNMLNKSSDTKLSLYLPNI